MNNHPRPKPDFSHGAAKRIDPEFLPTNVRGELMLHLNTSRLTDDQKIDLIEFAGVVCQMLPDDESTGAEQRKRIRTVEENTRRLLNSMRLLGDPERSALQAHTRFLVNSDKSPINLGDHINAELSKPRARILSSSWDWLSALEKAAGFAADQYKIDKQSKPDQARGRCCVIWLAEHIQALTGEIPPKDPASWFAGFAECLGKQIDLKIGTHIIKSGIESIR